MLTHKICAVGMPHTSNTFTVAKCKSYGDDNDDEYLSQNEETQMTIKILEIIIWASKANEKVPLKNSMDHQVSRSF